MPLVMKIGSLFIRMGATGIDGNPVPGCELKIGPYEIEVDSELTEAEYVASRLASSLRLTS